MKIENIEKWPEACLWGLWKTKFELVRGEECNEENMRAYALSGENIDHTGVILISNTKTIKLLDRQIPTTQTTYWKYIKLTGLVDIIIEENEGLIKDGEAHLFFYFYKNS